MYMIELSGGRELRVIVLETFAGVVRMTTPTDQRIPLPNMLPAKCQRLSSIQFSDALDRTRDSNYPTRDEPMRTRSPLILL
jgi:hypothetical protein